MYYKQSYKYTLFLFNAVFASQLYYRKTVLTEIFCTIPFLIPMQEPRNAKPR